MCVAEILSRRSLAHRHTAPAANFKYKNLDAETVSFNRHVLPRKLPLSAKTLFRESHESELVVSQHAVIPFRQAQLEITSGGFSDPNARSLLSGEWLCNFRNRVWAVATCFERWGDLKPMIGGKTASRNGRRTDRESVEGGRTHASPGRQPWRCGRSRPPTPGSVRSTLDEYAELGPPAFKADREEGG